MKPYKHGHKQPAIAPPHLSNERGAKRYDDRAERAERIASRHDEGTRESVRTRGRKQARHGEATTTRETTGLRAAGRARKKTSHEQRTTTPRPACRKNGTRGETRTAPPRYSIRSHRPPRPRSRAVLSIINTAPFSPARRKTAGGRGGRRGARLFMRNMKTR